MSQLLEPRIVKFWYVVLALAMRTSFASGPNNETILFSETCDESSCWAQDKPSSAIVAVSSVALADSSKWNEDTQDPPLSVRKALEAATEKMSLIEPLKKMDIDPAILHLLHVDGYERWIWAIEFAKDDSHKGAPIQVLPTVVLMDGSVVLPRPAREETECGMLGISEISDVENEGVVTVTCQNGSSLYSAVLPKTVITCTPTWLSKDYNPPVSARGAVQRALTFLKSKQHLAEREWKTKSISLRKFWSSDKYHWIVGLSFMDRRRPNIGPPAGVYVLILMDGQAHGMELVTD